MAKKSRQQNPREIAERAVQEWYESLLNSDQAHTHGSVYQVLLDDAFGEVQEALSREHEAQNGPLGDEDATAHEVFAREAGYLIGVQVGLRLRGKG